MLGVLDYHGKEVTKDGRQAARRILAESIHDHMLLTLMVVNRSHRHRLQLGSVTRLLRPDETYPGMGTGVRIPSAADIGHPMFVLQGTHDKVFPLSVGQAMHHSQQ